MKEKLTLSVEKSLKRRARQIARQSGKSISNLFEQFIESQDAPDEWSPSTGSGVAELIQAIPKEQKKNSYNYKKLKSDALKKKFPDG